MIKQVCFAWSLCLTSAAFSQDVDMDLARVDATLKSGQATISQVLSKDEYMKLHANTAFREIIKKNAKAEQVTMVTNSEPGTKITVKGLVKFSNNEPVAGALVYVYQTSDKGWYSDTAAHILRNEGDMRHARLFAYFKTDNKGAFQFETIKPRGYPRSDLPAHIHIAMWKDGEPLYGVPGELLFEDDERLTPERKQRSLRDGFLVSKNTGSETKPVYAYDIKISKD